MGSGRGAPRLSTHPRTAATLSTGLRGGLLLRGCRPEPTWPQGSVLRGDWDGDTPSAGSGMSGTGQREQGRDGEGESAAPRGSDAHPSERTPPGGTLPSPAAAAHLPGAGDRGAVDLEGAHAAIAAAPSAQPGGGRLGGRAQRPRRRPPCDRRRQWRRRARACGIGGTERPPPRPCASHAGSPRDGLVREEPEQLYWILQTGQRHRAQGHSTGTGRDEGGPRSCCPPKGRPKGSRAASPSQPEGSGFAGGGGGTGPGQRQLRCSQPDSCSHLCTAPGSWSRLPEGDAGQGDGAKGQPVNLQGSSCRPVLCTPAPGQTASRKQPWPTFSTEQGSSNLRTGTARNGTPQIEKAEGRAGCPAQDTKANQSAAAITSSGQSTGNRTDLV